MAFVFALHPLHVESVAWVAERKDVLSALFWMLTFWAYLKYSQQRTPGRYCLVLLMFACGLMSKPMIVTLPLVLLLLDVWPLRRIESIKTSMSLVMEKLPLFALSIAASVVTYLVQARGAAVTSFDEIPIVPRLLNALDSYFVYIAKLIWPANLVVFYPFPDSPSVPFGIVCGLAIVVLTILAIRVIRQRPYLAVGWIWYLITLIPVIGLVQVGLQSHADRYT